MPAHNNPVSGLPPRECGPGWNRLIDCLLEEIRRHQESHPETPEVGIRQIKEKLGGLRIHYFGGDNYIEGAVRMAEAYSRDVCECCGSPSSSQQAEPGPLRTRCMAHQGQDF